MVKERGPERTQRSFSSVFNSSVPQRPVERGPARAYGGRPLGPNTYNPSMPRWHKDPQRAMGVFTSKTPLRQYDTPLTSQIDYLGHAGQLTSSRAELPGSRGHGWPDVPDPLSVNRDPGLDNFCDAVTGSVSGDVAVSSRKYAPVFQSAHKRNQDRASLDLVAMPAGFSRATSPMLGPGVYDTPMNEVHVRDPKRASYTFKSQTVSDIFGTPAGQPPDAVQSIQSAILSRHWTSKGVAFSTRERFPRCLAPLPCHGGCQQCRPAQPANCLALLPRLRASWGE